MLARIFARSAASSAVPTEVDSVPGVGYITSVTAGWSSPVARWAHNPKVAGSNPAPATMKNEGLADAAAASPFRLPRLHPGIGFGDGAPACDARLLDHLVGPLQERRRDRQAEGLRGLEVDDQLELRR